MNDEERKYLKEALDIGTHVPLNDMPNTYAEALLPLLEYLAKFGAGISKNNGLWKSGYVVDTEYILHSNYSAAIFEIEFLFINHKTNDEFKNLLSIYVDFIKNQENTKKYSIDFQRKPFNTDLFTKVHPIKAERTFYNSIAHRFVKKNQIGGFIKDYDVLDMHDDSWIDRNIILLNTKISNSYLGNNASLRKVFVTNCNIQNSIIFMNVKSISDCKIINSKIYMSGIHRCLIEESFIKKSVIEECEIYNKSRIHRCELKNGVWVDNSKLSNKTIEGNIKVKGEK